MNIPGNDISSGETCVSYVGAAPPKGSTPHRYVILGINLSSLFDRSNCSLFTCILLLVFKQEGRVTYTGPKIGITSAGRSNTRVRDLIHKYNLGNPVAGNFYLAEWDSYVPKIYQKLKG